MAMIIKRDRYLDRLMRKMHNGAVKVVTGVRRSGKTFLLFRLFRAHLKERGIDDAHIIAIALDEDENAELRDPGKLREAIVGRITDDAMHYVLIDEVQYAITNEEFRDSERPPRIYGVLIGLMNRANVDVYVTGSNSHLLSSDVMTQFSDRGDEVHLQPLSFAEFMSAYDGETSAGWQEYVRFGGLPRAALMTNPEDKAQYLQSLFAETYVRDILRRHHIRHVAVLDDLIDVLASDVGSLTSIQKIERTFKSVVGLNVSDDTLSTYVRYLKEAFLVEEAKRYDLRGRRLIGSPLKCYFCDVGLRNARLDFAQDEPGHLMENVLFLELKSRGFNVRVGVVGTRQRDGEAYRRRDLECDFVATLGDRRYYLQSSWELGSGKQVEREKRPLLAVRDSYPKIVVTNGWGKPWRDREGIVVVGILDFLLDPDAPRSFG